MGLIDRILPYNEFKQCAGNNQIPQGYSVYRCGNVDKRNNCLYKELNPEFPNLSVCMYRRDK